jgi:hypothetical protein
VGHTPTQLRRVQTRLDRRVVMLDTGMLTSYYSGRPAALVIEPEATYVRYLEPDATVAWADIDEAVALGLSAERIDALLKHGGVREIERLDGNETGELVLTLEGTSIPAWFYANRSGELELAADKLDQRLGTDLVPPTVAREIDGTAGAVQLRYPDEVTESTRIEAGLSIAGWCPMEPQLALMNSYDVLIYNRSRNRDNIAFNNDFSDLTLTAHGQVFGSERNLFPGFDPATLEIPAGLVATLRALDEPTLTADLGDWLDRRQIRALLSRRDQLLKDR